MSPENRTRTGFGPLPARSKKFASGAVASLALVMLGLANPTLASASAPASETAKDRCDRYYYFSDNGASFVAENGGGDCRGRTGPAGPPGRPGATGPMGPPNTNDIDSTDYFELDDVGGISLREELSAVLLNDGSIYVGQRDLALGGGVGGPYTWDLISDNDGFPESCDPVSLAVLAAGGNAYVKVLCADGEVWETVGERDVVLGEFVFDDAWLEVAEPAPLATKKFKAEKALTGAPTNSVH
ncbi:hypothetical protein [Streptomyces sp. NPDC059165]|uniref:hypothetical protein n=1 Tax=Streptomyces sp. NPDC059165 TaxID=3346751 RepID=UPI0036879558